MRIELRDDSRATIGRIEIDPSLRAVLINAPELRGNSVLTDGRWPSNKSSVGETEPGRDIAAEIREYFRSDDGGVATVTVEVR